MTLFTRSASRRRFPFAASAAGLALLALAGCSEEATPTAGLIADASPAPTAARSAPKTPEAPAPEGSVDPGKLMSGQVLPDIVIGRADAPITIVEYASMTCDHCAAFHAITYPSLKRDYIDTGKAKLIIREFPFDPRAVAAFMLARCTPGDGGRTAMVDALFSQSESWAHAENASEKLFAISRMAGFSDKTFKACLADTDLQSKVVATKDRGLKEFGVDSTPTFFINGKKYRGALKPEQMSAILDSMS